MTTEHRPRPPTSLPGAAPTSELKRIPLPPLPHFRRPGTGPQTSPATPPATGGAARQAPAGSVSHLEMSELLGPDHEGGIAPTLEPLTPQRSGATGATILNDLVDEIEKGLEKELARAPIEATTRGYRRTVACGIGRGAGPERRTGE